MPEFYRLGMTKEEINDTLQTAVREPQPVVAGNFAAFTKDGQIIDSEKSAADFAPAPLDRKLTLYVNADTGSDNYDGLSAATAKRTINGALAALPMDLSTMAAIIEVADGVYNEIVVITGFSGGANIGFGGNAPGILIKGASKENTKIKAIIASCNTNINMRDLTLGVDLGDYNGPAYSGYRGDHYFYNCNVLYGNTEHSCVNVIGQSSAYIYKTQLDSENIGIDINNGGYVFVNESQIKSDAAGIRVIAGFCSISASTTITASAEFQMYSGGIAFKDGKLV